jgi:hypothetical protein
MGDELNPFSERESRLDAVIADYLEALESGRPIDKEARIARHPDAINRCQMPNQVS